MARLTVNTPDLSQVRCVVFDAVGTLIEPAPRVADAYQQIGARHGADLERDEVHRRFHAAFARQEEQDRSGGTWETSDDRERTRWTRIVDEVFHELADTTALLEDLWQHFAHPSNWRVLPDAAEAVTQLHGRGLLTAVASNFDSRLFALRDGLAGELPCRRWFASSALGYRKPAAQFFAAIQTSLDLPAEQLLLVGDDPQNDLAGARSAGWQALLVDRSAPHESSDVLASLITLAARIA